MPNWCACSLSVNGDIEYMGKFYETLSRPNQADEPSAFSFHQIVPSGNELDWYKENTRLWGTKWDCNNPKVLIKTETSFLVQFLTAWTPPIPWIEKTSELFPDISFVLAYCEIGQEFYGIWSKEKKEKYKITFNKANGKPDRYVALWVKKYSLPGFGG